MPVNPKTKFREPSGLTGEWQVTHCTRFWHTSPPANAKFEIEKLTGILLERVKTETQTVAYFADSTLSYHRRQVHLRLEASCPGRRLYEFRIDFEGSRNWLDEDEFLKEARRVFDYWSAKLNLAPESTPPRDASAEFLEQDLKLTLEQESILANQTVDQAPILAIQNQVLAAVKAGATFSHHHKEGSNTLAYRGSRFMRIDEGEYNSTEAFPSEQAFLTAVRNFFDWESRRDIYPHAAPELDVWRYILNQLRG